MAAYFISDIVVTDPEGIKEYQQRVGASLELYGGKFLVRGGTFEVLEGDWHPHRLILLEFESVEQAKRWYNSAEYASVKGIRHRTANADFVLVQGL
jgi:uncharacterized protein (DUF1330 family)